MEPASSMIYNCRTRQNFLVFDCSKLSVAINDIVPQFFADHVGERKYAVIGGVILAYLCISALFALPHKSPSYRTLMSSRDASGSRLDREHGQTTDVWLRFKVCDGSRHPVL
jgi:hypothetical protein